MCFKSILLNVTVLTTENLRKDCLSIIRHASLPSTGSSLMISYVLNFENLSVRLFVDKRILLFRA